MIEALKLIVRYATTAVKIVWGLLVFAAALIFFSIYTLFLGDE